jgi:hypothetical protein
MLYGILPRIVLMGLVLSLIGCATYYQPRYGQDGVYYDDPHAYSRTSVHVGYYDPLLYPYWSLDYFYFSRHYHPYSVLIHYHDPWYYPYPGWYYGYRPGPRSHYAVGWGRYYYPWHAHGYYYHYYRPWRPLYVSYPRETAAQAPHFDRVRLTDDRLRHTERRERAAMARIRTDGASGESGPISARRDIQRTSATDRPGDVRIQRQRSEGIPTRPIPRQQSAGQSRHESLQDPQRARTRTLEPRPIERGGTESDVRQQPRQVPPPRSQPRQRSSSESAPTRQESSSPPPRRSSGPQRQQRRSEPRSSSRSQRSEPPVSRSENRSRRRD